MTFFAIIISTILVLAVWQIDKHQKWSTVRKWLKRSFLALLVIGVGSYAYFQISDSIQQKNNEKLAQEEVAMRECIAGDIPRMEALASKAVGSINENMTIDQAATALKTITSDVSITVASGNIRDLVVHAKFETKCKPSSLMNSRFGGKYVPFSIVMDITGPRIVADQGDIEWDNKITKLETWMESAPDDYTLISYNKNYAEIRFNPDKYLATKRNNKGAKWWEVGEPVTPASKDDKDGPWTMYQNKSNSKSSSSANAFDQFDPPKSLDDGKDYCAPGLSKSSRLQRLAKLGKVRQTGSEDYEIEGSSAHFVGFVNGSMYSCR